MKRPFGVTYEPWMVLLAMLFAGTAGVASAQIPGPGQFGSQGQGGAPAGQFEDVRNIPMTQRGSIGPGYGSDTRNSPIGQRDANGGLAGGGQLPSDRRNSSLDPRRTYGGTTSQYPADPRNTPLGQRGVYGSQGASGTYGGSGGSYGAYGTTGGYGATGTNTAQPALERNAPIDPLHTYSGPSAGQYSSDSRNPATGPQGLQQTYRPHGGVTDAGGGRRAVSGTNRMPGEQRRIYGGAKTSDDLAAGAENATTRQPGAKGKEAATTALPYPGDAENAAARKADAKGRAGANQPGPGVESGSERDSGRQTDMKGGEPAFEPSPASRNMTGGDRAQPGARRGTSGTTPRYDASEEPLKKRAPASGENSGQGTGSPGDQPGNAR
jgi:hypothetical protein